MLEIIKESGPIKQHLWLVVYYYNNTVQSVVVNKRRFERLFL